MPRKPQPQPFLPSWGWILVGALVGGILAIFLVGSGIASRVLESLPSASSIESVITAICLLAGSLLIYIAPSLIALGTPRVAAIVAANILLGWTVLGWIGCLVWALAEQGSKKSFSQKVQPTSPLPPPPPSHRP